MDRGGGRGRGSPSGPGSSLPRELHGSLLHTGPQEQSVVPTEEHQPLEVSEGGQEENSPYPTYTTSSARSASAPYSSAAPSGTPTFEEGSSRASAGTPRALPTGIERPPERIQPPRGRNETPHLYLPPFRAQGVGSTDPALYAASVGGTTSTGPPTFYSYPPPAPAPARLPSVRTLERGATSSSVAGASSSQYYTTEQARNWNVPTQEIYPERQPQRQTWDFGIPPDDGSLTRPYQSGYEPTGEPERWMQFGRPENYPQDEGRSTAAHRKFFCNVVLGKRSSQRASVSAARSTIWEPSQASLAARGDRYYQPPLQLGASSRQSVGQDVATFGHLPPFYEAPGARLSYGTAGAEPGSSYDVGQRDRTALPSGEFDPLAPPLQRPPATRAPFSAEWLEPRRRVSGERPPTPPQPPPEPSTTALGKRPATDDDEDEPRPRKVSRKTQIACFFCRGKPVFRSTDTPCMAGG